MIHYTGEKIGKKSYRREKIEIKKPAKMSEIKGHTHMHVMRHSIPPQMTLYGESITSIIAFTIHILRYFSPSLSPTLTLPLYLSFFFSLSPILPHFHLTSMRSFRDTTKAYYTCFILMLSLFCFINCAPRDYKTGLGAK